MRISPRTFLLAAYALTVLAVPLTYEGAVQRNASANFDRWEREMTESLPPESPGIPLIPLFAPPLYAAMWGCGGFIFFVGLMLSWLVRHSLRSLPLWGRLAFLLVFFAGPAVVCALEALDAARWGFWLLALSALVAAAAVGMGACAVFAAPRPTQSVQSH